MEFLAYVWLFGTAFVSVQSVTRNGPVGPFNFHEIKDCDPLANSVNLDIKVDYKGDQSDKVSASVNLPQDIGEEIEGYLSIDQFEDNEWQVGIYEDTKPFLEFVENFGGTVWKNLRNAIVPKIEDSRHVPAGEYVLTDFKETYKNLGMPQIFYGRFRVTVSLSDGDDVLVCKVVEMTISEPTFGM